MSREKEIYERLRTAADLGLEELAVGFKRYAEEIDAEEWAAFAAGETRRFVDLFRPMIRDLLVGYFDEYPDSADRESPIAEATVLQLIKGACERDFGPTTWPWRTSELFDRREFMMALRRMIDSEAIAVRQAYDIFLPGTSSLVGVLSLAEQTTSEDHVSHPNTGEDAADLTSWFSNENPAGRRKPGPQPVPGKAQSVKTVFLDVCGGKKLRANLVKVCKALDVAKVGYPKTWKMREPPILSWTAAAEKRSDLAMKAIKYQLKKAQN